MERPIRLLDEEPLDLEELRRRVRLSEIDFDELRQVVAEVLDRRTTASIAKILECHPATQGLASVLGLMVLADAVGVLSPETENLTWESADGHSRTAKTTRHIFHEVPDDWGAA